jgi:hypothetical protein
MLRCSRRLLFILVVVSSFTANAAELGEARVSSHIGQPLVADIELAMIDDPAAPVSVRLASPEVYNGAGIAMPPVLASVNLSVMKRDGRQYLHVTSLRPVDGEHLHLYLELVDKGQRTVRLATLWLTADPNPAPVQVPYPAAVQAAAVAAHAEPAAPATPAPVKTRQFARPLTETAHVAPKAAVPALLPNHTAQPVAAVCVQQAEQAKVCAALDGKNAALNAKIGALEGKVKSLQAKLGAAPAGLARAATTPAAEAVKLPAAAAPAAAAAHAPPGPKPISAIKPLVPRKPKAAPEPEPESASGLPWGWIGGAATLLLALGGALLLLRRRARTVRNVDIPAAPRLVDRLRDQFPSRSKTAPERAPEPAAEAVEPSFE